MLKNILSIRPNNHEKVSSPQPSPNSSVGQSTQQRPNSTAQPSVDDPLYHFTEGAMQIVRKLSVRSASKGKQERNTSTLTKSSGDPQPTAQPAPNPGTSLISTVAPAPTNTKNVVKARPRSSSVDEKNRRRPLSASERELTNGQSTGSQKSTNSSGLFRGSSLKSVKSRQRTLSSTDGKNSGGDIMSKLNIVPGTCGIHNHGNTCYINSVVQLLSHLDGLAKYLVLEEYTEDIHRMEEKNLTSAQRQPRRRDLTDSLAILLRSLWRFSYMGKVSEAFRTVLGTYEPCYLHRQQDAHELLLFLLNTVHEETNQARKALFRRRAVPGQSGPTGDIMNSVRELSRTNRSRLFSLFAGYQLYYTICPQCRGQTNRVQPYMALSLPIPADRTVPLYWIYVPLRGKPLKMGLLMSVTDTLAQLRTHLARKFNLNDHCLVFCDMNAQGFTTQYSDEENVLTLVRAQPQLSTPPATGMNGSNANKDGGKSVQEGNKLPGGLYALELPEGGMFTTEAEADAAENVASSARNRNTDSVRIVFTHVERWPALPEESDVETSEVAPGTHGDQTEGSQHRRREKGKPHYLYRRFSAPLALPQPVTVHLTYDDLVEVMVGELAQTLYGNEGGVDHLLNRLHDFRKRIRLHVVDGTPRKCDLRRSHAEYPLMTDTVRRALQFNSSIHHGSVPHVKFTISWKPDTRRAYIGDRSLRNAFLHIASDPSVAQVHTMVEVKLRSSTSPHPTTPAQPQQPQQQRFFAAYYNQSDGNTSNQSPTNGSNAPGETQSIHLVDCLQAYLSSEELSDENAIECGKCHSRQRMTVRSALWSTPDMLVLHLKRFVQSGNSNMARKLRTPVEYPLTGLDIRPYIDQANGFYVHAESFTGRDRESSYALANDYLYDLVGVCNHQGNLQEGHYKSYCLSPVDHKWRCYDDDKVTAVDKNLIPQQNAYILVYERRTSSQLWNYISHSSSIPPPSTSTTSGGTNGAGLDSFTSEPTMTTCLNKAANDNGSGTIPHWAYRHLDFPQHCFGVKQTAALERGRSGSSMIRPLGSERNPTISASTGSLGASRTDPLKRKKYPVSVSGGKVPVVLTKGPLPGPASARHTPTTPTGGSFTVHHQSTPMGGSFTVHHQRGVSDDPRSGGHAVQHHGTHRRTHSQERRPATNSSRSGGGHTDGSRTPPISTMDYALPLPSSSSSSLDPSRLYQGAAVVPSTPTTTQSQPPPAARNVAVPSPTPRSTGSHPRPTTNAITSQGRPHSLYVESSSAAAIIAPPHHNSFVAPSSAHRQPRLTHTPLPGGGGAMSFTAPRPSRVVAVPARQRVLVVDQSGVAATQHLLSKPQAPIRSMAPRPGFPSGQQQQPPRPQPVRHRGPSAEI